MNPRTRMLLLLSLSGGMVLAPAGFAEPVTGVSVERAQAREQSDAPEGVRRWGQADPKPKAPGSIRIATYNVENLFDTDPTNDRNNEPGKPMAQQRAVADAIRAIDADILTLQEIESESALLEFRDRFIGDMGYEHVVSIDCGDDRGIEQSVLSRFPLKDAKVWPDRPLGVLEPGESWDGESHKDAPASFRRSPLRVTAEVRTEESMREPYEITMFIVHHKSGGRNEQWRTEEAKEVAKLAGRLESTDPDVNILILGDFNSVFGRPTIRTYVESRFTHASFDGTSREPAEVSHASGRTIDLILANSNAMAEVVRGSCFILGTVDRKPGQDWRTTPKPAGWASDHYPVCIDLIPVEGEASAIVE